MLPLNELRQRVLETRPLIHCITNPISINQCANALLAIGTRPIMAEHPKEVRDITGTADALMLNLGNITDARMESMVLSAQMAKETGIPILLDAVGVACSTLRREYIRELLQAAPPTVLKGNYSEINALHQDAYRSAGVDADEALSVEALDTAAAELARRFHCVVLASGKTDIVTDGSRLFHIHNGTAQLSTVTGTGCMLGALCAGYLSAGPALTAAVTACALLGVCGEIAETDRGSGSFLQNLMDGLSTLSPAALEQKRNLEEISLEKP